jgi:hypothetical protein
MFMIEKTHLPTGMVDRFGPFPTIDRAEKYSKSFDLEECSYEIWWLTVPYCVTVKLNVAEPTLGPNT